MTFPTKDHCVALLIRLLRGCLGNLVARALVHSAGPGGSRMLFPLWFEHPDAAQTQRRSPSPHPEDVVQGAELAGV